MSFLENEYLSLVSHTLAYLGVAFVLFFVGKSVYQLFHKKINVNNELIEKDNFSFSIAYVGYFIGLVLAIGSAIVGPSNGLVNDIVDISTYGGLAIILLNLGTLLNDKLLLPTFSIHKEIIEDKNVGTGVVEAANSVASGLIIFGAVTGENGSLASGLMSALVFWAIGQLFMLLVSKIYNLITPYDIHEHIEKNNVAVGIGFAGSLIAIANLIRFGLMGDFESWSENLINLSFDACLGLLMLPVIRYLTDRILLPGQKLSDEIVNQDKPNNGAALVEAFSYVGGSVLMTWCL